MISIDRRPLACLPPVRRSFLPVDLEPRVRGGGVVLDVEGHMPRVGRSVNDVEGHMPRITRGLVPDEQSRARMPRVRNGAVPDVEGHMPRIKSGFVDALDVEGHMPRINRGFVAASPRLPNRVDRTSVVEG